MRWDLSRHMQDVRQRARCHVWGKGFPSRGTASVNTCSAVSKLDTLGQPREVWPSRVSRVRKVCDESRRWPEASPLVPLHRRGIQGPGFTLTTPILPFRSFGTRQPPLLFKAIQSNLVCLHCSSTWVITETRVCWDQTYSLKPRLWEEPYLALPLRFLTCTMRDLSRRLVRALWAF
jgi:hypothetical protein